MLDAARLIRQVKPQLIAAFGAFAHNRPKLRLHVAKLVHAGLAVLPLRLAGGLANVNALRIEAVDRVTKKRRSDCSADADLVIVQSSDGAIPAVGPGEGVGLGQLDTPV